MSHYNKWLLRDRIQRITSYIDVLKAETRGQHGHTQSKNKNKKEYFKGK
jgi:hypothetical protein